MFWILFTLKIHDMLAGFLLFAYPHRMSSLPFFRPWMGFIINFSEMLKIEMSVDLRRADITMPQQLLHRPQVLTGFKQMTGE